MPHYSNIHSIKQHLNHRCDGPVTTFVLISRAMEAVKGGGDPEEVANALYEEMRDLGALSPDEDLLSSGEY